MQNKFSDIAIAKVDEFITAFGVPRVPEFWHKLVLEEAKELIEAIEEDECAADALKETCDFFYVMTGFYVAMRHRGLEKFEEADEDRRIINRAMRIAVMIRVISEEIFREAFDRVHASNMSKLGEDGKPIRREDGKAMKGPNYKPPVLDDLVEMMVPTPAFLHS
jgi:hypothetical protein